MTVVVDSNIVAATFLPTPYTPQAIQLLALFDSSGESLMAAALFEYEIATILRRSVAFGLLAKQQIVTMLDNLLGTRVITVVPTGMLHHQALHFAERIGQTKAYSAQYLALAAQEHAAFWTADRRLARSAQEAGFAWVNWIGDGV